MIDASLIHSFSSYRLIHLITGCLIVTDVDSAAGLLQQAIWPTNG